MLDIACCITSARSVSPDIFHILVAKVTKKLALIASNIYTYNIIYTYIIKYMYTYI